MGNPRTFHVSRRWLETAMETCWATNLPETHLRPSPATCGVVHNLRLHNQDLCVCKELLSNASFRSIYEVISQSVCTRKFQQRWIEQYCAAILKRRYVWTIYEFMSTKVSFFSFSFFLIKFDRRIYFDIHSNISTIYIILIVRFFRGKKIIVSFWKKQDIKCLLSNLVSSFPFEAS